MSPRAADLNAWATAPSQEPFRIDVALEVSPCGKITGARLRSSTGSAAFDAALVALLLALPAVRGSEHPLLTASNAARLPVAMTIDLRKSL